MLVLLITSTLVMSTLFFCLPFTVNALEVSTDAIRAGEVWATGNQGQGVNVAVIDSGCDTSVNWISGSGDFAGAIVARRNIEDDNQDVTDTLGHGTHVAGIIAGRGSGFNPDRKGVAWQAGLVIVKIMYVHNYELAVQWIMSHRVEYNIRVISSSIGLEILGGDGLDSSYSIALDNAVDAGIVVVQAAGNDGDHGPKTIDSPGNSFNVITVGAVDDRDTSNIDDDELADYPDGYEYKGISYPAWGSSKGPTGDGRPKPDVVAPGVHVWSTRSWQAPMENYEDCTGTETGGIYGENSGTSVAAPHVSGTVALMLHVNPNLTPAQVKAILRQTARLNDNLNGYTVNDRGYGIIDAYAAVQLSQNIGDIDRDQMYDGFDVTTPNRILSPLWDQFDFLTFTVDPPSIHGISLYGMDYHYRNFWGAGGFDYRFMYSIEVQHVWIDDTYYNLGDDMHRYLFSGPRITEKGEGYVKLLTKFRFDDVYVDYECMMHVDYLAPKLNYDGGSSWKTLIHIDPDVQDTSNYPYLPSTGQIVYYERKVTGDVLADVRDLGHSEHVEIDPDGADDPIMWILRYDYYFGNNPDTRLNDEYVYDRDIVVYYQGTSDNSGPVIYRTTESLPEPNPPPETPSIRSGYTSGYTYTTYAYWTNTTDPEGDSIHYQFDWGDGNREWTPNWYASGANATLSHSWSSPGTYYVRVRAEDSNGAWSDRSSSLAVTISDRVAGGCPILSVYDGTEYALEGLLDIHNPDGIDEITSHVLIHTPEPVEQRYLLRLTEHPQTYSHLDQVQLFAMLTNGTEVKLPLVSAIHSENGSVKQELLVSDDVRAVMLGADWNNGTSQYIDLKFVAPDELEIETFTFIIEGHNFPEKEAW